MGLLDSSSIPIFGGVLLAIAPTTSRRHPHCPHKCVRLAIRIKDPHNFPHSRERFLNGRFQSFAIVRMNGLVIDKPIHSIAF